MTGRGTGAPRGLKSAFFFWTNFLAGYGTKEPPAHRDTHKAQSHNRFFYFFLCRKKNKTRRFSRIVSLFQRRDAAYLPSVVMPAHNNQIANAHFKKDWQGNAGSCRVRTWFNQAGRKKSRRIAREKKAQQTFPRPTAGALRPVVRPMTQRYNFKTRLGRGFTLEELKVRRVITRAHVIIKRMAARGTMQQRVHAQPSSSSSNSGFFIIHRSPGLGSNFSLLECG